ncbi:MAG TPA: class I SAM-dependent methyltransferase [Pyrinomonadaceae bacterium]
MSEKSDRYVPALGHDVLTPLYDAVVKWTTPESTFKRRLVRQANIERGQRILDLGCGTATLTLLLKQQHPDADVKGADGDPKILRIARAKAERAGAAVAFDHSMAYALPYPDGSFDRVLSSLMFHHLTREDKSRTFREVRRVLRAGGELHFADFGKPHNALMYAASLPWRLFDGRATTRDNVKGELPPLLRDAGFAEVCETARYMTMFGTLSLFKTRKPA